MQSMQTLAPDAIFAGRYKIEGQLGIGGFGAVYRGQDIHMKRAVALKTLLPHLASVDGIEDRFLREATLASGLNSPHTIKFFDFGKTDDGALYIAMELLNGQELEDVLQKEGPVTPEVAVSMTLEILDSLAEAHHQNIVHRDLKPSNIFLSKVGRRTDFIKVLDFGIAKAIGDESNENQKKLTATGQTLGTPYYMAPEQILQQQDMQIGPHTDLYALGLIIIEMLTGSVAVDGNSPIEIVMVHASPNPIGIPQWIEESPLGPIVRKAIEKHPSSRYASAEEMIADLEQADLTGMIIPDDLTAARKLSYADTGQVSFAQTIADTGRSSTMNSVPRASQADAEIVPPPVEKNNSAKYVLIVLLAFLLAIGIYFLARSGSKGETPPQQAQETTAPTPAPETAAPLPATNPPPAVQDAKVIVKLQSNPAGAEVFNSKGENLGTTPFTEELVASGETETWTVKLDGYKPEEIKVDMKYGDNKIFSLSQYITIKLQSDPVGAILIDPAGVEHPTPHEIKTTSNDQTEAWTLRLEGYEDLPVTVNYKTSQDETFALKKIPPKVTIKLTSSPSGATVINAAGEELGSTPYTGQIEKTDATEKWTLKLTGYRNQVVSVSRKKDFTKSSKLRKNPRPRDPKPKDPKPKDPTPKDPPPDSSSGGSIVLPD